MSGIMEKEMTRQRVDIIGGGLAGLLAGIELAGGGVEVTILEAAGDFGGRAQTRDLDGFLFNRGPHALYVKGALKRELDRFAVRYTGGRSLSGARKAVHEGKLHHLPTTLGSIATTSLLGIRDKLSFAALFKRVMNGATGDGSFADWLDGQRVSAQVRMVVEAMTRLASYTRGSDSLSAREALDQLRLSAGGTMYIDGGWMTIVHGLMQKAQNLAVQLRSNARVEQVNRHGSGYRLRLANGEVRETDAVVMALAPHEASALLPEAQVLAEIRADVRPVRANTLDLALRHLPEGANDFALGIDVPFYLSVHSGSAKLAADGGALVHIAHYLAVGENPAKDAINGLEGFADLVMPGWRAVEVHRQTLRGMVVSHGLPRWDRSRPEIAAADYPGLFLAGDWVGNEGMIGDAAAASAIAAARSALNWLSTDRNMLDRTKVPA